jgi:hypothetical protein
MAMLTNKDFIAVNQQSTESAQVLHDSTLIVWRAKLKDGRMAVAVFNTGDATMKVDRTFAAMNAGLGDHAWHVRDVWATKDLGKKKGVSMQLAPHACVLLMLQ